MATATYDADLKMFVAGAWRASEDRQPVLNPATGQAQAEVPLASAADLDEALAAADRGFKLWRETDVEARAAILHKAAALIRERADRIGTLMTLEQGKPLGEAKGEVIGAAQLFDYYAEEAKRAYGRVLVRPTGQRSIVIKQPVGPVASFTPWNFPVYLMAKKLAAALAAGCSVIAKPPEETPGCTSAIIQALADAGLPADVAQLVFGVPDTVSRHLLASPVIRKVSFTGSVSVGRHLMRLAADGLKRVTMELGGHAPVLIFDDCDLDRTLDMVVPQKFRNAGQVCVSPTRFYVQQGIYDRFVEEFAARTANFPVGNGLEPSTKMGPLANVAPAGRDRRTGRRRGRQGSKTGGGRRAVRGRLLLQANLARRRAARRADHERGAVRTGGGGPAVRDRGGGDRTGQPPALRSRRLRLYREWPPRQPAGRPDRSRHGRHQHVRDFRGGHAVRRGEGLAASAAKAVRRAWTAIWS